MGVFLTEGPKPRLWVFLLPVIWVIGCGWVALHFILKYW
jgi:hypothetical protein